jgi:hypothetical protein
VIRVSLAENVGCAPLRHQRMGATLGRERPLSVDRMVSLVAWHFGLIYDHPAWFVRKTYRLKVFQPPDHGVPTQPLHLSASRADVEDMPQRPNARPSHRRSRRAVRPAMIGRQSAAIRNATHMPTRRAAVIRSFWKVTSAP